MQLSRRLIIKRLALLALCFMGTAVVSNRAHAQAKGLRRCKTAEMSEFACGQCEPELIPQFDNLLTDVSSGKINSVENFLASMTPEMKANYTVVGNSKSSQPATSEYPRIMFKSPNAELWVTIGTDPKEPSYKKVEVMRWNGKEGKFVFQEIDFDKKNEKVNHNAEKDCAKCHRSPNRPNFDTYVSWAGFLPPRDDTLEKYVTKDGQPVLGKDGKPIEDPSTKAYMKFMNKVISARSNPASNDRLKYLMVPPFNDTKTPDAEKMVRIKKDIDDQKNQASAGLKRPLQGYRIQHNPPDQKDFKNFDSATVNGAGFNHVAFDQLTDLNSCAIATRLKHDPKWNTLKFGLVGSMKCGGANPNQYLPEDIQKRNAAYFSGQGIGAANSSPADVASAVSADVEKRQKDADNQKSNRHKRADMAEGLSEKDAAIDAETVRGVSEQYGSELSSARYLLEPMGIRVQDWSMTFGDNLAQPTYNFADQLDLFFNKQEIFEDVRKEYETDATPGKSGDYCQWLREKSLVAWASEAKPVAPAARVPASDDGLKTFIDYCKEKNNSCTPATKTSTVAQAIGILVRKNAYTTLVKYGCMDCHSNGSDSNEHLIPWSDVRGTVSGQKPEVESVFRNWLNKPWTNPPPGAPQKGTMLDKVYWAINNKFPASHASFNMPPDGPIKTDAEKAGLMSTLVSISSGVSCERYTDELEKTMKAQ